MENQAAKVKRLKAEAIEQLDEALRVFAADFDRHTMQALVRKLYDWPSGRLGYLARLGVALERANTLGISESRVLKEVDGWWPADQAA